MLYLIEDRDYLKIGYAKNFDERWKSYMLHNCYCKPLSVKEGAFYDEQELHKLCTPYRFRSEWYYNTQEVIDIFNNYQSNIKEILDNDTKILHQISKDIVELHQNSSNFPEFKFKFDKYIVEKENEIKSIKQHMNRLNSRDDLPFKEIKTCIDYIEKLSKTIYVRSCIIYLCKETIDFKNPNYPTKENNYNPYYSQWFWKEYNKFKPKNNKSFEELVEEFMKTPLKFGKDSNQKEYSF